MLYPILLAAASPEAVSRLFVLEIRAVASHRSLQVTKIVKLGDVGEQLLPKGALNTRLWWQGNIMKGLGISHT